MINWTYLPVPDLPTIPEEFLVEFLPEKYSKNEAIVDRKSNRVVTKHSGEAIPNIDYNRWRTSPALESWIVDNICSQYMHCGISVQTPGNFTDAHTPHNDHSRDAVLLWIYDPGGDDATTVFWQMEGHPVVQPERGNYPTTYHGLSQIDSVQFPLRQWHLLNTHVMHSVEHLSATRLAFHVSLAWENFKHIHTKAIDAPSFSMAHDLAA